MIVARNFKKNCTAYFCKWQSLPTNPLMVKKIILKHWLILHRSSNITCQRKVSEKTVPVNRTFVELINVGNIRSSIGMQFWVVWWQRTLIYSALLRSEASIVWATEALIPSLLPPVVKTRYPWLPTDSWAVKFNYWSVLIPRVLHLEWERKRLAN